MILFRRVFSIPLKYLSVMNTQSKNCHSVFGLQDLMKFEKLENFRIEPVRAEDHETAVEMIRKFYLKEHVLVRARNVDLDNDYAIEEYLLSVLKQGNSLFGRTDDGKIAGICASFACSPIDPRNLRNYAFYRQDQNTRDFLYFTAKLQETPNLWELYKQSKIFEIKMLAVLPEYRRQGLATMLTEKSKENALDQGYKVVRMDCINAYDFKIAERCMLQCIVKFPLHKLRSTTAPYIKSNSEFNRCGDGHRYNLRHAKSLRTIEDSLAKSRKLVHMLGPSVHNRLPPEITRDENLAY